MEETWKELKEANGKHSRYQISNMGYIRSINTSDASGETFRILKQYHYYAPSKGIDELRSGVRFNGISKDIRIHKAVAQYFVPNPNKYKYVRHIDGNIHNNRADNLIWTRTATGRPKIHKDLWQDAVNGPLPDYGREVIAMILENNYTSLNVALAHRSNNEGARTYGKGEWNIPNVIWWIDTDLPELS